MADFNAGDVAEGIFTLACVARFMKKNEVVTLSDIQDILKTVIAAGGRRSTDTIKCQWKSPNMNPNIKDVINLTIRLANNNLNAMLRPDIFSDSKIRPIVSAALHYVNVKNLMDISRLFYTNNQINVMDFVADGIGNQKGTKQDMFVKVSGPGGKTELNLSISLKAGAVKQFGQIGGSEPAKQKLLWELFGFDIPGSVMSKYTEYYAAGNIKDAMKLSYEELADTISKTLNYNTSLGVSIPRKTLKSTIIHFMIGDEDIELVQLDRESKTYKPKTLVFPHKITATIKPGGSYPEILIASKDTNNRAVDLLRVRMKLENRTQYVRNYIEKGSDLYDMQAGK